MMIASIIHFHSSTLMDSTPNAPPSTPSAGHRPEPDPRDKKKFYFADTPQRRMLVALARALFRLVMEMSVEGLAHFPANGPVILAANHLTTFDVFPMRSEERR